MFKKEIYLLRRNQLRKQIKSGIILIPGAIESPFNSPDNCYRFRQDSNFLYLTGIDFPGLFLVMDKDSCEDSLFGNDPSFEKLMWSGQHPSVKDHCQSTGIKTAASFSRLENIIKKALDSKRTIHFSPPGQPQAGLILQHLLGINYHELKYSVSESLIQAIVQLRSIKDEYEIREIESAVNIAYKIHTTAMEMAIPGVHEQEIKGVVEGIAISEGGGVPYQPIVTTRGDILHNLKSCHTLEKDRLLVVDAGAETLMHYASDITRTIPVGRTFNSFQKNIYEIVLKTNLEAIRTVKPGISFKKIHMQAALTVANGLQNLGIMKGDPEEAVQSGAHALFFPHGLGHMLGLDVHDMENMGEDFIGYTKTLKRSDQFGLNHLRLAKPLETGFVITIEPGIYFILPLIEKWRHEKRFESFINYDQVRQYSDFGGIRIEDNILVTESGSRVLGKPIPKTLQEIEI